MATTTIDEHIPLAQPTPDRPDSSAEWVVEVGRNRAAESFHPGVALWFGRIHRPDGLDSRTVVYTARTESAARLAAETAVAEVAR